MSFSSNLSENRIRGLNKVVGGCRMMIEGGKMPIITYSLGRGGSLRIVGDSNTHQEIPARIQTEILNALLHAALDRSEMKMYDSNDATDQFKDNFPLLPNAISSNFWNQGWTKEYLSQILKHLGYGSGGTPFGQGPPPPGYPEDKIKWTDFKGPSANNFKGNYVEIMFQMIISILKHFKIDGETHVVKPPLGKFVPKSKRSIFKDNFQFNESGDNISKENASQPNKSRANKSQPNASQANGQLDSKKINNENCNKRKLYSENEKPNKKYIVDSSVANNFKKERYNSIVNEEDLLGLYDSMGFSIGDSQEIKKENINTLSFSKNNNKDKQLKVIQYLRKKRQSNGSVKTSLSNIDNINENRTCDVAFSDMESNMTDVQISPEEYTEITNNEEGDFEMTDTDTVIKFLNDNNLSDLIELFISEDVTMDLLQQMSAEDLKELGVSKFGQRFKILKLIQR